jgi:hypothetical protein
MKVKTMSFLVCTHCKSFVPQSLSVCPNCDTTISKPKSPLMRKALQIMTAASVSVTLSACYGMPPCGSDLQPNCLLDYTLPDTNVPTTDMTQSPVDQALPVTDQALPVTDQALPVTDQALPVTDQALPAVDQSMGQ